MNEAGLRECDPPTTHRYDSGRIRRCRRCGKVFPADAGLADLLQDTDLLLRWGHLPDCGEGAEFPWDCTCDWKGSIERIRAALAKATP